MAKKTKMTQSAARRIQSHADRNGTDQTFKSRAQSAAAKNSNGSRSGSSGTAKSKK